MNEWPMMTYFLFNHNYTRISSLHHYGGGGLITVNSVMAFLPYFLWSKFLVEDNYVGLLLFFSKIKHVSNDNTVYHISYL